MSVAFAFALALLAQEGQATLQSCVFEADGWVCRYRVPEAIYRPETAAPARTSQPTPAQDLAPGVPRDAEAVRQDRLIRRCADAGWLSLCTPGDRREAQALKARADIRESLRLEVTALAAKNQCADAIRVALEGGDLDLAREIRAFCAPVD
ncbi:MAG: hypothetical protein Q7V15_05530 [Phenylobacterium sp.]|uniref:hypothetical protein n=1 Tax=Phenylobacterium sp. TaxID=1871053 RepID=UPI0027248F64|nr:hypothetical protein [Phenylobacterium sp.]MDO8900799.1 hypothetical protein [Phenylobacterium sp.]MDP2213538.1 hypothetical protein [Phenylobacterium sp.]